MSYDGIIHSVSASDTNSMECEEYIKTLFASHDIAHRDVDFELDYDTSEIDRLYGNNDDLWQLAFERLTVDNEIWIYSFPVSLPELERLRRVRNKRGRRMFR